MAKNKNKDIKTITAVAEKSKKIKEKSKIDTTPNSNVHKLDTMQSVQHIPAKSELTDRDLAKIMKKKGKKLAQKLRKKQRTLNSQIKTNPCKENDLNKRPDQENINLTKSPNDGKTDFLKNTLVKKKRNELENKQKQKEAQAGLTAKANNCVTDAATVFIGNLPTTTNRAQLVRLLKPYGTVSRIRLRTSGGRILFKHKMRKETDSLNAYVILESPDKVEQALALNGTEFKGNHLRVTPALKVGKLAELCAHKRTIFVGNLKYSVNEEKLHEIFSSCGEIEYVRCLRDGEKGCKGVAYVCFKAPDAVGLALELHETLLDDRPINVERYSIKKLGAKEARDTAANNKNGNKNKKTRSNGAQKRIAKKQQKISKQSTSESPARIKKSDYRGIKVNDNRKKQKQKKKVNKEMLKLAKKIAPNSK